MPKVSVIVPNYNHARFLPQRLQSITQQDFKDYELILLDDASTDHSRSILQEWKDKHPEVQLVLNKENSGSPFVQWNKGAALAGGEYLWIAESDDYCEPQLLSRLVQMLEQNPQCHIAYAQSYLVDEEGRPLNNYLENLEFIYQSKVWRNDFVKPGAAACREWLLFHNPIPNASGALLRKTAYEAVSGADPAMYLNGDWYLYSRLLARGDLAFCAETLNYFRVHAQTQREKSRTRPQVFAEIIAINQFIRQNVPDADAPADAALRKIAGWWQGSLYHQPLNRQNWRENRRLYRFFKKYRQPLWWHIVYTLGIELLRDFMRFTGLLKPAKQLRKRLFPGKYFDL